MSPVFVILALVTIAGAVAALSLRNLVHCALALTVAFAGLAAFYLQLGSQFVGFAQILVYIGAVAILIVFAILLTRGSEKAEKSIISSSWLAGIIISVAVFGVLAGAIMDSSITRPALPPQPEATIQRLGEQLMTTYLLPLEAIGLLLTAALIGAVIVAMRDNETR
jgi:NADH:ubiquinone oxidoreductase subunit 6 (subunit J)